MIAQEQARFCLLTGQSPETYRSLSRLERNEFIRAATTKSDD